MNYISTRETGVIAEAAAVQYLQAKNYEILCRNYFCRYGELDIVARERGELVFIEVRSQVPVPDVTILELLPVTKLLHLQRTIDYWLVAHDQLRTPWRFEFIGVTLSADLQVLKIEHIPNPEL